MTDVPLFALERYCIDTNVIVSFMHERDEDLYSRSVFGQQWELIELLIDSRVIVAPERVKTELKKWEKQIPDMKAWLKKHDFMFRRKTTEQLALAKQIVNKYTDYGRNENYVGDLEVISLAGACSLAVISNEKTRPTVSVRTPKIPEVCTVFEIPCYSVNAFLRRESSGEAAA